jgi:toxoflavin synthase
MNDYDQIGGQYSKSHLKPDKRYSMVPSTLNILQPLSGRTVLDVGCGDGFFTRIFAQEANLVYGIDISHEQIRRARQGMLPNMMVEVGDMLNADLPRVNRIFSPFVLNYVQEKEKLKGLFERYYDSLNPNGILASIVDMPQSLVHDMRKFGSIKRIAKFEEGEPMEVEIYNGNEHLTTLHSVYHTKETIETLLAKTGFREIQWHTPIISSKGIKELGENFWKGYVENCDVAYFSARR